MGPTSNQSMSTINGDHWKQYQHPKTKCVVIVIGWDPFFQIQWDFNLLSVMADANDRHIQISPKYLGKLFVHAMTIDSSPLLWRWFSVYVSRKVGVWCWWKQIYQALFARGLMVEENMIIITRWKDLELSDSDLAMFLEPMSWIPSKNNPKPGTVSTQFIM